MIIFPTGQSKLSNSSEGFTAVNKREDPFWESSITTIRKHPIEFKKSFLTILRTVWHYIKIYFLFFCFDPEKESKAKLLDQLSSFIQVYYHAHEKGDKEQVKAEFQKLPKSIQEKVKKAIEEICKTLCPNQDCKEKVQELLRDPFKTMNSERIPEYAKALHAVQNNYADFSNQK